MIKITVLEITEVEIIKKIYELYYEVLVTYDEDKLLDRDLIPILNTIDSMLIELNNKLPTWDQIHALYYHDNPCDDLYAFIYQNLFPLHYEFLYNFNTIYNDDLNKLYDQLYL